MDEMFFLESSKIKSLTAEGIRACIVVDVLECNCVF